MVSTTPSAKPEQIPTTAQKPETSSNDLKVVLNTANGDYKNVDTAKEETKAEAKAGTKSEADKETAKAKDSKSDSNSKSDKDSKSDSSESKELLASAASPEVDTTASYKGVEEKSHGPNVLLTTIMVAAFATVTSVSVVHIKRKRKK